MDDIELLLNRNNPKYLAKHISDNFKNIRLLKNYTQAELAARSGVALANIKRFEQKAEISLINLLKVAVILDACEEFETLFAKPKPASIEAYLKAKALKGRKRARKKL